VRRRRFAAAAALVQAGVVLGLLSGCQWLAPAPTGDTVPRPELLLDRFVERCVNVSPSQDDAPLAVGAWWSYRDATADHLPTWQPGQGRQDRVLCTVADGEGRECYLLHSVLPDGKQRWQYIHRSDAGWLLLAEDSGEGLVVAPGTPTILRLPLFGGSTPFRWEYELGGILVDVQIIFTETVSVPAGTFTECRKVKLWMMEAGGCRCHSSAEAEFFWYARGIGSVKWVTGSRNYELTGSSYLEDDDLPVLDLQDSGRSLAASPGDAMIIQLPMAWDSPHRWKASDGLPDEIRFTAEATYRDLAPAANGTLHGTYVARVSVAEDAPRGATYPLTIAYGLPGHTPILEFELRIEVD